MAVTFDYYSDDTLTTLASAPLDHVGSADVGASPGDHQLFFGSPSAGLQAQAVSAPGVDQITLSITDAALGSGEPASQISFALTQAGLDTATPGAPLNLGLTIASGAAGAVEFWLRWTDSQHLARNTSELGFTVNQIIETPV